MRFVVVLEGQSQVMCGSIGIGLGHEGNIIALHGLYEALGHYTRHDPLRQDVLFVMPASLKLDARLTPLERSGWQVCCALRKTSPRWQIWGGCAATPMVDFSRFKTTFKRNARAS